jgi:hypothetical protein
VVLDVLREFHNADEDSSTEMKKVGDALTSVFAGYSLVVLHHTPKIPETVTDPNPVRYARGSRLGT